MTEVEIRSKALAELKEFGFTVWFSAGRIGKYRMREDIFKVFDLLAIKKTQLLFIQLTTSAHKANRVQKIKDFFSEHNCFIPHSYVWAWNDKRNEFDIVEISNV